MQNASSIPAELAEKISASLRENPQTMTLMVAGQFGVPEVEVVRRIPDGRAHELDPARAVQLIESFAALGPLYVIVSSGTVILESHGVFGGFSKTGPFFNVQTDSLDMHIRHKDLVAVFAVQKPSHMTSLGTLSFQFFSPSGNSAMKVFLNFGAADPTPEQSAHFERLVQKFKL